MVNLQLLLAAGVGGYLLWSLLQDNKLPRSLLPQHDFIRVKSIIHQAPPHKIDATIRALENESNRYDILQTTVDV